MLLKRETHKNMLVIVDLQRELVDMLTYRHGPVSDGIRRVEELIGFCKRTGMPISIVTSENWPDVVPSILDAAGPGTPIFMKKKASAFSDDRFARHVERFSPQNLIVCGSIRHLCPKRTAEDGLVRGHGVISSDEILFGSSDVDSPAAISEALSFYSHHTSFFPGISALEEAVRNPK